MLPDAQVAEIKARAHAEPRWLLRQAITFHESPPGGGPQTLGAFAHQLCGHNHLRTLDCECQGCLQTFRVLHPLAVALDCIPALIAALRASRTRERRYETALRSVREWLLDSGPIVDDGITHPLFVKANNLVNAALGEEAT